MYSSNCNVISDKFIYLLPASTVTLFLPNLNRNEEGLPNDLTIASGIRQLKLCEPSLFLLRLNDILNSVVSFFHRVNQFHKYL